MMSNRRVLLLAVLLVTTAANSARSAGPIGHAQDTSTQVRSPTAASGPAPADTIWCDVKGVAADFVNVFSRPLTWTGGQWTEFASGLGLVGVVSTVDKSIRTELRRDTTLKRLELASLGSTMGSILPGGLVAVALYGTGLVADVPSVRMAGRHVFESALFAAAVTLTVKSVLGRHRPFLDQGQYTFTPLTFHDDFNSFPSGHSTMAFSIASSLSADIDEPIVTVALYGLATVTAWSRVYDDRHWASDVLGGALVGTIVGHAVANIDDPAENGGPEQGSIRLVPTLNGFALIGSW